MDKELKERIIRNMNFYGLIKCLKVPFRILIKKYNQKTVQLEALSVQKHYREVINKVRKSGRKRLKFAAYVIYDSTYGVDGIFSLMLENPEKWECKVVIIPDILRGEKHLKESYIRTKDFFLNKYGEDYVIDGYDITTGEFFDLSENYDIIYFANPYDSMVHEFHSIKYASRKDVLPIYVSYGFDIGSKTTYSRLINPELNLVWKCFTDTTYSRDDYKKYQLLKGKNVVLAGYAKMDELKNYSLKEKRRKKVLITPHHTVTMSILPLSNFMEYYSLILDLPILFPDIDFVFRPHPLLFTTLITQGIWNEDQVKDYLNEINRKGIEYSVGGEYLNLFAECDAIINDCGSFAVEWLYTGKPGCFVYSKRLDDSFLTTLMQRAIKKYSIAKSQEDIIQFLRTVEEKENQELVIEPWIRENIMINYPNVSEFILKQLDILQN